MLTKENSQGFQSAKRYPISVYRAFNSTYIDGRGIQIKEVLSRVDDEDEHFSYYRELLEHEFDGIPNDDLLSDHPLMADERLRRGLKEE